MLVTLHLRSQDGHLSSPKVCGPACWAGPVADSGKVKSSLVCLLLQVLQATHASVLLNRFAGQGVQTLNAPGFALAEGADDVRPAPSQAPLGPLKGDPLVPMPLRRLSSQVLVQPVGNAFVAGGYESLLPTEVSTGGFLKKETLRVTLRVGLEPVQLAGPGKSRVRVFLSLLRCEAQIARGNWALPVDLFRLKVGNVLQRQGLLSQVSLCSLVRVPGLQAPSLQLAHELAPGHTVTEGAGPVLTRLLVAPERSWRQGGAVTGLQVVRSRRRFVFAT